MPPTGAGSRADRKPSVRCVSGNERFEISQGAVIELSNYELVRYPSGQLNIIKVTKGSSFRDVVGAFTNEADAQQALQRLYAEGKSNSGPAPVAPVLVRAA